MLASIILASCRFIQGAIDTVAPALTYLDADECERIGKLLGAWHDLIGDLNGVESPAGASEASGGALPYVVPDESGAICERHQVAGGPCVHCLNERVIRLTRALKGRDSRIASLERRLTDTAALDRNEAWAAGGR